MKQQDLLWKVIEITEQAAAKILAIYEGDFSVENKLDDSPLTAADMASHEVIVEGLSRLTPEIPVLSEESASIPYDTRRSWQKYWLVDPLDGTKEFIRKNGEFTVNIALIDNHQPVVGIVQVPVSGVCYFSAQGIGAFKKQADGSVQKIHTLRSRKGHFKVAGSRSHGSEMQQAFFRELGDGVDIIAIGSSLKFCLVAEGEVDIYPRFGPTSEWDTAAAHAIVLEAGGVVKDTNFLPLEYNRKESLLNPHFLVIGDPEFNWKDTLDKVNPESAE